MKNEIWRHALVAAAMVMFMSLIGMAIAFYSDNSFSSASFFLYTVLLSILHYGFYIGAICYALVLFQRKNNGRITSRQAYGIGFATVLIVVLIDFIFGYVTFEFITKQKIAELESENSLMGSGFSEMSYFDEMMLISVFTSMLVRVVVMLVALYFVGRWKMFQKAGEEGWASIIPLYNTYKLIIISGNPGWYFVMLLIPVVNIVFGIMILNGLSAQFGKSSGYTWGLIFLGLIFMPMLGFDENNYFNKESEFADPSFGNA